VPRTRTSAVGKIAIAVREAMVDALAESGLANEPPSRQLLVRQLRTRLRHQLIISDQSNARNFLIEIVEGCAELEDGLEALLRVVRIMLPHSLAYERLHRIIRHPQVRDLLPPDELELLRECLTKTALPQLQTLVRRAAGLGAELPHLKGDAWEAVQYLADCNADVDGFPSLLTFVELLARHAPGPVGQELQKWNDDQAHRMGFEAQLQKRRAEATEAPPSSRLHLLFIVERDAIDPQRCVVSSRRQDDPEQWPPPLGDTASLTIKELEQWVDDEVVSAERAWAGHAGTAALEFALPRELLNLPVHQWQKEYRFGSPRPLFLDYSISVRSLERALYLHWHRAWRQRWSSLIEEPFSDRVLFGLPDTADNRHMIKAVLTDQRWVMMVLTAPPMAEPSDGGSDELTAALQSGLPALLWHPSSSPDNLRQIVSELTADGGLTQLPQRLAELRRRNLAVSTSTDIDNIVRDLIILWDDPKRLVIFDQQPGPPQGASG
jgi:vWA-MoxR associated protein C-terminal domain/vWA-MoxR associated protein middle region 0/Effector-associated domain 2